MTAQVIPAVADPETEPDDAAPVTPDGYAPSKWAPLVYSLVAGIGACAIASIIAVQINSSELFHTAYAATIVLGLALVATLRADSKAGPRGWSIAEDVKED